MLSRNITTVTDQMASLSPVTGFSVTDQSDGWRLDPTSIWPKPHRSENSISTSPGTRGVAKRERTWGMVTLTGTAAIWPLIMPVIGSRQTKCTYMDLIQYLISI